MKRHAKYAMGGSILSAGAALLSEHGSDAIPGQSSVVGENGPELMMMPQGARIIPNIKDGYDMLNYITKSVKGGKSAPPPQVNEGNKEVSNTAMIAALNDKLDYVARAIKRGR